MIIYNYSCTNTVMEIKRNQTAYRYFVICLVILLLVAVNTYP